MDSATSSEYLIQQIGSLKKELKDCQKTNELSRANEVKLFSWDNQPATLYFMTDITKKKALEKELRRDRKKFRNLSIHNNLTGLYNTRYLYQTLDKLIEKSKLNRTPFSLVFMDMDYFKQVVDTYGHLNGSQALKEVAATIKSCIKRPCFGVAYGGDEFVIVLPGFD